MNTLPVLSSGGTFDVYFPLHPGTDSPEDVSRLVESILHDIEAYRGTGGTVSQSDVLQALAIATAVHVATADASDEIGEDVKLQLLDLDLGLAAHPEKSAIDA